MTATSTARIPAEYLTDAVTGLLAEYERTCRADLLPVLADALQDAGCHDAHLLDSIRAGVWQATEEGSRVVTVGRAGADHDRHGNGIYTTKVYEAVRRRRDGRLVWRLAYSVAGHRTAGKGVTGPMSRRAEGYAASLGVPLVSRLTHGTTCL